jgi:hypothetical protein
MRPVAEWLLFAAEDRAAHLAEWERKSKHSENWQRVPSRSIDLQLTQSSNELIEVKQSLSWGPTASRR